MRECPACFTVCFEEDRVCECGQVLFYSKGCKPEEPPTLCPRCRHELSWHHALGPYCAQSGCTWTDECAPEPGDTDYDYKMDRDAYEAKKPRTFTIEEDE